MPLLEWVGSTRLPVSSIFTAAQKAIRETTAALKAALLAQQPQGAPHLTRRAGCCSLAPYAHSGRGAPHAALRPPASCACERAGAALRQLSSWLLNHKAAFSDWDAKHAAAAYLGHSYPALPGPSLAHVTAGPAAANANGDAAAAPPPQTPSLALSAGGVAGHRKWLGYVLKWLAAKLVQAMQDVPVTALLHATPASSAAELLAGLQAVAAGGCGSTPAAPGGGGGGRGGSRSAPPSRGGSQRASPGMGGGAPPDGGVAAKAGMTSEERVGLHKAVDAAVSVAAFEARTSEGAAAEGEGAGGAGAAGLGDMSVVAVQGMRLCRDAGLAVSSATHPLQLLVQLGSLLKGYDGPELVHLGLAVLQVRGV